jgi:XTP/dITP diphosphohydrolase
MAGRVVLLVTSPRLPAGLLTAQAWDLVRTHPVLAGADSDQTAALRTAGVSVTVVAPNATAVLDAVAIHGTVVWLGGPVGDPELARELGLRLAREPSLAELELMYGSWDPSGARLLDAVAILDRLLSPGGDPWKRAQTHTSLAPFLLEEAYEAQDAILSGDFAALREELGDVLLQVVLHARLAEEAGEDERFGVDDVAGDLVDKLIRRNPHVFGTPPVGAAHQSTALTLDEITENWERIKQEEKARTSTIQGIALAQPALSLAAKLLSRAERAGTAVHPTVPSSTVDSPEDLGPALFSLVIQARALGLDPETELRRTALAYADVIRAAESIPDPDPA